MQQLPEPNGVVYMLTNLKNGKVYIGQTICLLRRSKSHFTRNAAGNNASLRKDLKDFGHDDWNVEILAEGKQSQLNDLENYYIKERNSFVDFPNSNGYNRQYMGKMCREFIVNQSKRMKNEKNSVIVCVNDEKRFEIIDDVVKHYGLTKGSVKAILRGLTYKTRTGLRFEYRES